jgi:osmotically-inducible protein OsmY
MNLFNLKPQAALLTSAALVLLAGLPVHAARPDTRYESSAKKSAEMDSRIESSARNSYNFRTYLKDDTIKVESAAGVVTLTGTVSRDYHKYLAAETVADLPGVKSVNNQLTVAGEQPSEHSDGWISMKVKARLTFHKNVSAADTEVHTEKGVVTLTGSANTEAQRELTGEYAKDVDGVTEVRNNLIVNRHGRHNRTLGEKVDDSSITAQLKTALLFHKSTRPMATKVHTRNGVVSLSGEAKNQAEKDMVTKVAEDITGVKRVKNHMTVKPA